MYIEKYLFIYSIWRLSQLYNKKGKKAIIETSSTK